MQESGFLFCEALVNLFYGDGLVTRIKAAAKLALIGIKEPKKA